MKKSMKKLFPIMLVILLSLSLVDCSCSEPAKESETATESGATSTDKAAESTAESKEEPDTGIAGQYEITAMVTDGKETTEEDLALMKSKGLNCVITLNGDGTGVLDLFGDLTDLTWNGEIISAGEKDYSYTFRDGELILTNENSSLTFLRTE